MNAVQTLIVFKREEVVDLILEPEVQAIKNMKHDLALNIQVKEILSLMEQYGIATIFDKEKITAVQKSDGDAMAAFELLDRVVRRPNFWENFITVLKDDSVGLRHWAKRLEEEKEKVITERKTEEEERQRQSLKAEEEKRKEEKMEEEKRKEGTAEMNQQTSNRQEDVTGKEDVTEDIGPVAAKPKYQEVLTVSDAEPRKYQLELARPGIEGRNQIVCAPTGSGKTHVSALIIKAHLHRMMKANSEGKREKAKVLYLTPRFTILQHVLREFQSFLPLYSIGHKHGGSNTDMNLKVKLEANDVVVVTADIFKNALADKEMSIFDVTLVLFDECHYTMDKHSYNQIMKCYLQAKSQLDGASSDGRSLPQIIGLTASPGAGGSLDPSKALEHIMTLCGNLDAQVFQTVPKELEKELMEHIHHPSKNKYVVSRDLNNRFLSALENAMTQIEEVAGIEAPPPGTQQYESKMSEIITEMKGDKHIYAQHLVEYNNALRLSYIALESSGYDMLTSFYTAFLERRTLLPAEEFMLNLFQQNDKKMKVIIGALATVNESLQTLKKCLLDHDAEMKEQGKKLSGMIFVRTISTAHALKAWMRADAELKMYQPEILIGSAKNDGEALSKAEQLQIIRKFNGGLYSILICTTVASEGVDIQACNVTVKYHHVTDEINMIQSRGRARAADSKEIVIGWLETSEKDRKNVGVEVIMRGAIEMIKRMSSQEFQTHVAAIQRKILKDWERQDREISLHKSQNNASDVELLCAGCVDNSNHVCFASDVRLLERCHYVIPDEKFQEKYIEKDHHKEKERKLGITKIFCRICGSDWGIKSLGYPCLKLKSFIVMIKGRRQKIKQWSKLPCQIQEF